MAQQTAVDYLIEQLQAPCRGIPTHIIEHAKQMEKEQIVDAFDCDGSPQPGEKWISNGEQYYNETYGNKS